MRRLRYSLEIKKFWNTAVSVRYFVLVSQVYANPSKLNKRWISRCSLEVKLASSLLQLVIRPATAYENRNHPPTFISYKEHRAKTRFLIRYAITQKLLGLIFYQKLTLNLHVKKLEAKCIHSIGILKYRSHPSKYCNPNLLIQLYKSLIRLQLDYEAHTI